MLENHLFLAPRSAVAEDLPASINNFLAQRGRWRWYVFLSVGQCDSVYVCVYLLVEHFESNSCLYTRGGERELS